MLNIFVFAQCPGGQTEVTIDVGTDNYGFEIYWELTPSGSSCGNTATIFSGGNTAVGCSYSGNPNQIPSGGYANGTTISDFFYGKNKRGDFQKILKVFGRTDQLCYRCKSPITKIFVGQRGTHYCNKCQNI